MITSGSKMGRTSFRLNRVQDSVNSYSEALKIDPFFKEAYIGRGNAFMDYGHDVATRYARWGQSDHSELIVHSMCWPCVWH